MMAKLLSRKRHENKSSWAWRQFFLMDPRHQPHTALVQGTFGNPAFQPDQIPYDSMGYDGHSTHLSGLDPLDLGIIRIGLLILCHHPHIFFEEEGAVFERVSLSIYRHCDVDHKPQDVCEIPEWGIKDRNHPGWVDYDRQSTIKGVLTERGVEFQRRGSGVLWWHDSHFHVVTPHLERISQYNVLDGKSEKAASLHTPDMQPTIKHIAVFLIAIPEVHIMVPVIRRLLSVSTDTCGHLAAPGILQGILDSPCKIVFLGAAIEPHVNPVAVLSQWEIISEVESGWSDIQAPDISDAEEDVGCLRIVHQLAKEDGKVDRGEQIVSSPVERIIGHHGGEVYIRKGHHTE